MVKIPKEQNRYCPFCDEHHEHTLKAVSNKPTSPMRKKHRKQQRKVDHGYGSFPYENPAHRSRGSKNPISENKDLEFTCKECGKTHKKKDNFRAGKLEIER